jgi:hypothetical protein
MTTTLLVAAMALLALVALGLIGRAVGMLLRLALVAALALGLVLVVGPRFGLAPRLPAPAAAPAASPAVPMAPLR